jgi:hypothetical protein
MKSGHKISKKKLIWVVLAIVILFYPLAVFIRAETVPFYANTFYRSGINKVFASSFSSINQQLRSSGFNFPPPTSTCYNGISDSGNAWYHDASETVLCTTKIDSDNYVSSSFSKAQWQQIAPQIESKLSASGFSIDKADYNYTPGATLNNIFNSYDQEVSFKKNIKNVACELRVNSRNPNQISISEICQRYVSFFGGSRG